MYLNLVKYLDNPSKPRIIFGAAEGIRTLEAQRPLVFETSAITALPPLPEKMSRLTG